MSWKCRESWIWLRSGVLADKVRAAYRLEMMLRYLGWTEAADLIIKGMTAAIAARTVTYDLARVLAGVDGLTQVSCSGFGEALIARM